MDLGLRGKVALVAAASKGLGYAIALELSREGARVAICGRDEAAIAAAAERIAGETRGEVLPVAADVSTADGCEAFVQSAVARYGGVDVLVVNAGGPPPGRFDELDDEAWRRAFDLTLMSAVRLTRLGLAQMRRRGGGSIVYSTSTTVKQPIHYLGLILSNSLRSSVHGMAKTLAADLAREGIRVNAVQPGRVATDRVAQLDADTARRQNTTPEAVRRRWEEQMIPMGRYGTPEEYAAAVVFLASPRASYITGVSLQVDGGMVPGV